MLPKNSHTPVISEAADSSPQLNLINLQYTPIQSPTKQYGQSIQLDQNLQQEQNFIEHQTQPQHQSKPNKLQSNQSLENKFKTIIDQNERTITQANNEGQTHLLNNRKNILLQFLIDCPINLRMNKAVRHFKDALYLREPRTDIDIYKNKYILILYEFFTNPKWHNIMILMSLLFISQVFIEPTNSQDTYNQIDGQTFQYLIGQESVILILYFIDTISSLMEKPLPQNQIWKKQKFHHLKIIVRKINWKFILKLALFNLNLIDYAYFYHQYPSTGIRFSRILRPIWIAFYSNEVKDTLISILKSFKNIFDLIAFYFVLALFWAYLGYNLLSDVSSFYFQDFFYSFISIYSSYSMDSYPDMMLDPLSSSYLYLLYFLPFFALNLWFLMPLPTPIIFQSYKSIRANMVVNNKLLVQEALINCFICLDVDGKGYLNYKEFLNFFSLVFNGRHIEKNIERMWKGMDVDGNNEMQIDEFVDILYILDYWPRVYERSSYYWDLIRNKILHYLKLDLIVHSNIYLYTIVTVVFANTISIIIYATTDPSNTTQLDKLGTLDTVFNSIYIADCLFKVIGYGVESYFDDPWCRFDFCMLFVTIISMIGIEYLHFLKKAKSSKLLKIVKIEKVLRILRSVRGIKLFQYLEYGAEKIRKIKILLQKISITFPIALRLLYTILFFFYFFSIIGMEVFNTDTNQYNQGSPFQQQDYANFNSFPASLLILFQVCTESNWINQMFNIAFQFDIYSSFFFFCGFHLISVFFLASLLKGLIWEGFYIVDNTYEENKEEIQKLEEENEHAIHHIDHFHRKGLIRGKEFEKIFEKYKIKKYSMSKSNSVDSPIRRQWSIEEEQKGKSFHYPYQTVITKIQNKKHNAVLNMKKIQKAVRKSIITIQKKTKTSSFVLSENEEQISEEQKNEILILQFKDKLVLLHEHSPKDTFVNVKQVPIKYETEQNQSFDIVGLSVYCFNEKGVSFHIDKIRESLNQLSESSIKSKQKIEVNQKKKQQMMDVGALHSQGQLMEKTILKDFDKNTFAHMKSTYMNELYGNSKKFFISAAAMNLSNLELMRLKRSLRYQEITPIFAIKQMYKFEKNISRTIMKGLAGIKFIYEINDRWYYVEKSEGQYIMHKIRQSGIWNFYKTLMPYESMIYKADNILNLHAEEDDQNLNIVDQVYSKFSCQLISIFQFFKPYLIEEQFIDEEHMLLLTRISNHKGEEILEDIQTKLNINNPNTENIVQNIMALGLYQVPRQTRSFQNSGELKGLTVNILNDKINKNPKEDVHDLEREDDFSISLFAFMEFFKDIRDVMYNYQSNWFYNIQYIQADANTE